MGRRRLKKRIAIGVCVAGTFAIGAIAGWVCAGKYRGLKEKEFGRLHKELYPKGTFVSP